MANSIDRPDMHDARTVNGFLRYYNRKANAIKIGFLIKIIPWSQYMKER